LNGGDNYEIMINVELRYKVLTNKWSFWDV